MPRSRTPSSISKTRRRLIPFGWYGGKFSHLKWLLPLLPEASHYCEPFGGSGAVLLNRAPSPVETYNDLDGEVVNFFRVLRTDHEGLMGAIAMTPFSREEFAYACQLDPDRTPFERARCFFVRARQVRAGLAQTASVGRWANCKLTSRAGMSGVVSRWLGSVEGLSEVAERLLRVQIENRPAEEVIRLYDSPTTLFYCDPPYLPRTRVDASAYGYEMSEEDHVQLAALLNSVQGKVAFSNYDDPLLDQLYPPSKWTKEWHTKTSNASPNKASRTEVIWTNYPF